MQLVVRVAYRGAAFRGSAWQPGLPTVVGALLARLRTATAARPYAVSIAARTDAGVSARENFVTLRLPEGASWAGALAALTTASPDGLGEVVAAVVPRRLMARNLASARTYHYRLGWRPGPTDEPVWRVVPALAAAPMQAALDALRGHRDFSAWARRSAGGPASPVCRLAAARAVKSGEAEVTIELTADRFLRQMARRIAMAVATVGAGLRPAGQLAEPLAPSAPAQGLTLHRVEVPAWLRRQLGPAP